MSRDPWILAGWVMVHFFWSGTAFAAIAAIGKWTIRFTSPEIRYAYGLVCLAILASTPPIVAACLRPETRPTPSPSASNLFLPMPAEDSPLPSWPDRSDPVPTHPSSSPIAVEPTRTWPDASR
ncbi:MAG: hypothetical protein U0800_02530 [Isosphaeraceae bacterium]